MRKFLTFFCTMTCLLFAEAKIQLSLESRDLQLNSPFEYDIIISNADDIGTPQFPKNDSFRLLNATPMRQNSTQMTIVNGKMTKNVINNTTYQLKLLPLKEGTLNIPSIEIKVDGKRYKTEPIPVTVSAQEQITDIVLELVLPEKKCYVGQPIMATWHWYVGRRIENFAFDLPILGNGDFTVPAISPSQPQKNSCNIPNQQNLPIIGEIKSIKWNGLNTQRVDFSYPIIPKEAGTYTIDAGSVTCAIIDKQKKRRNRNDFFDMDAFFDRMYTKDVCIQGNKVTLEVLDLPEIGQPANFSGIIGKCNITMSATPTDVNVGDPIALDVCVSGLPYLDAVRLPSMNAQEQLASDFRISDEDSGTIKDNEKHFQCTIRAQNQNVTAIPSLQFSYFDTASGTYETISTEAIPLKVHAVKTITALDAIGASPGSSTVAPVLGKQIKALDDGIAHNYAIDTMLFSHSAGFRHWSFSDWRLIFCMALALLYLLCAVITMIYRHRNATPEVLAAKVLAAQALNCIESRNASAQDIASAIHDYFRAKLLLPAGADTFADIEPALLKKKLSKGYIASIKSLFDACEAIRFSGDAANASTLQAEATKIIHNIKL